MMLLRSPWVLGALGSAVVIFFALQWYTGRIESAEQRGYSDRELEIQKAMGERARELNARNSEYERRDAELVAERDEALELAERAFDYAERESQNIDDRSCPELSAQWVQLHNTVARPNCWSRSEDQEDCTFPEVEDWTPQDVAPRPDDAG